MHLALYRGIARHPSSSIPSSRATTTTTTREIKVKTMASSSAPSNDLHNVKMGASAAERNAPHIAGKVVPRLLEIQREEKSATTTAINDDDDDQQAQQQQQQQQQQHYAFEIGSGQGVHASVIAPQLPDIDFVLSDISEEYFEGIKENVKAIDNVLLPPVTFDARDDIVDALIVDNLNAVVGACLLVLVVNICHISPIETTKGIFATSEKVLAKRGILYIYGPFNVDGKYTSEGNERFDKSMKEKDERFGIRDISELEAIGETHGLKLNEIHEMPANNFLLGWIREHP
jgi:hypothetical protein